MKPKIQAIMRVDIFMQQIHTSKIGCLALFKFDANKIEPEKL